MGLLLVSGSLLAYGQSPYPYRHTTEYFLRQQLKQILRIRPAGSANSKFPVSASIFGQFH